MSSKQTVVGSSGCWLYVNETDFIALRTPTRPQWCQTCRMRISLDSGCHTDVSEIRLIVATKSVELRWQETWRETRHSPSYRVRRTRASQALEPSTLPSSGRQLTIVFLAYPHAATTGEDCGLDSSFRFLRPLSAGELADYAPNPLRILYDATYELTPTTHAILATYEYEPERRSEAPRYYPPHKSWHYELRVLPSSTRRGASKFPALPPHVVTRIVEIATLTAPEDDIRKYAQSVFPLATVSKQWIPALDLIWSSPSWKKFRPVLPLKAYLSLASSIISSPHIAEQAVVCPGVELYVFDPNYLDHDLRSGDHAQISWQTREAATRLVDEKTLEEVTKATWGILKSARGLKIVHANSLMMDLRMRESLKELDYVEQFCMVGPRRKVDKVKLPAMTMEEVWDAIRGWTKLEKLLVVSPQESRGPCAHNFSGSGTKQTSQLRVLQILNGYLDGRVLHELTLSTLVLQKVQLTGLQGLSNADIRNFLLTTASSLEAITVERCVLTTGEEEDREGLALDVALGHMLTLRTARIQGDLVSNLALIAPPPPIPLPHAGAMRTLTVSNCNVLSVLKDTDPCGLGIVESLQIGDSVPTGQRRWESIILTFAAGSFDLPGVQMELERAQALADRSWAEGSGTGFGYSLMKDVRL